MNIDTKGIITYTRKTVVFLIAIIYRSACEHPFVLGLVFFLLLLYRFLPFLFGFVVSSSPLIICTALLLGALLSFGQPNIPEIEEEETTHGPSPQVHAVANDLIVEEDESFSTGRHVENREKVEEAAIKEAKFTEHVDRASKSGRGILLSVSNEEEERKPEAAVCSGLPLEVNEKQIHIQNIATNKGGFNDRGHFEEAEVHEAKLFEDATELAEHAYLATSGQNETEVLKAETHEPAVDGQFDSSLVSSWKLIAKHGASESDSDHAESSSPDASMADIIPMLDELHPLLDSEDPLPVNAPVDDIHSVSDASTEDGESDDGSVEEEAENQGEGQEEEEEEEAKEENEDGAALAVKWTEDDAKNLIVLGTSELERNQRLENLIAKRRARKNLRAEAEKNLIDLDTNETVSMIDELSCIQMQIPPISTARRNPFDLPYDSEESISLPPIPGSAPSVLLPRRNPFDLPHDQADESSSLTRVNHQGLVAVPQREMFFRRHESFDLGASFTGEFKQEKHGVKWRPYFVTERTDLEGASYTRFQRQLSEKSDTKVSSVLESESISSIADQDYNDELSEQQLRQESEVELVSSSTNEAKLVERESNSTDEVDSVDPLCRHKEINICSSYNVDSSAREVFGASIHEVVDDLIKLEEQNRHGLNLWSPISDAAKSDVAEEKYSSSSSSCSSELSMKNLSTKSGEGSTGLLQPSGDSLRGSSGSVQSVSGEIEVVNDCHVVEPVYDSSPSAIENSLSNIASLEEQLLHGDEGSFRSTSSISSETLVETSGIGSPERNIFPEIVNSLSGTGSMGEMPASADGGLWVAPLNLSCVEEIESRSREVEVIREQDVIQVEFTEVDEYDHPTASTLPEADIEQIIFYSSSSSTDTDSSEDSTIDMGVDLHFSEQGSVVEAAHSDVLGTSNFFSSQVPANAQQPLESSTVQTSFDTFIVEQQVEILSSIHRDISEYVKHEERYENASTSATIDEAEWSNRCSTDSKDEVLGNQENGLPECLNGSDSSYAVHASVEEMKKVDDEALLLELDAIGDFHVEELRLSDSRTEMIYQYDITEKKISEEPSYMKSEAGGSEVLLTKTHLLVENSRDLPEVEVGSLEDIHIALKSVSEVLLTETHLLVEHSRDLQDVEARSLEDIRMALKNVSEGTTENPPNPMETKCILDPQEAEPRLSEDLHIEVSEGTLQSSKQSDILHLQNVETRPTEDTYLVSKDLSECTNDCPPKLIDNKNDSSIIEARSHADMEEVEARSLADIDVALKHACEGTADDLPKLEDKKDGYTEVEVIERNLEPCILEGQTYENIELAGAVRAKETDQSEVPDKAEEIPHGSSSSSSAPRSSRKKEKSHESDLSSSSSSSSRDSD